MDALTEAQSILSSVVEMVGLQVNYWGGGGRCAGGLVTHVLTWVEDGRDACGQDVQLTIWVGGGRDEDSVRQNARFTIFCCGHCRVAAGWDVAGWVVSAASL